MSTSIKKEYLEILIRKWISNNPSVDISSKIADILSSPEERYKFAADLSDSSIQLSEMVNVSERTCYRYLKMYNIKLKDDKQNK